MTDRLDPRRRLAPVVRLAPAKLNLTLAVTGRRKDGFHELHSVMVPLGLSDRLSLAAAATTGDSLHVDGLPTGAGTDDLVLRALAAVRTAVGAGWAGPAGPPPPLAARLEKRIPVSAGLAGGSSDAAATIDAALEAWGAELMIHERLRLAVSLGSDVPFFLAGGAALVEGRGERVAPLRGINGDSPGIVLVTPPVALATAAVFDAWDAAPHPQGRATLTTSVHLADELRSGLSAGALVDRAGILAVANDLVSASATVMPELLGLRRSLARLLGRPVGQSGSGPTLWVLYPSLVDAAAAASAVREAVVAGKLAVPGEGTVFVTATMIGATEPGRTTERSGQ